MNTGLRKDAIDHDANHTMVFGWKCAPVGSVPKVNVYERKKAMGTAKLAIIAMDAKTKQPIINSGFSLARSDHQHWTMMGSGPVLSGSVASQLKEHTGSTESILTMPSNSSSAPSQTASRSNGGNTLQR